MPNEQTNVQSTQQSTPYLPQMDVINKAFGRVSGALDRPTGNSDAYNMAMTNLAAGGGEALQPGRYWVRDQLDPNRERSFMERAGQGEFIGSNPWLDKTFDTAAGRVRGQLAGQFAGGGRYGSGAMSETMGRSFNDLATQIYGGAYESDMNRALTAGNASTQNNLRAAALSPQIAQTEMQRLMAPYLLEQGRGTSQINDLSNLIRSLGGINFGNTVTSNTPSFSNPVGSAVGGLGGLASAAYLGSKALPGLSSWFNGLGGGVADAGLGAVNTAAIDFGGGIPSDAWGSFGFDTGSVPTDWSWLTSYA